MTSRYMTPEECAEMERLTKELDAEFKQILSTKDRVRFHISRITEVPDRGDGTPLRESPEVKAAIRANAAELKKIKESNMTQNQLALRYFKIDDSVPDLEYATGMSACFDLASNEDVVIEPGEVAIVGTGLKFDIPEGYSVRLHPRSSTGCKRRLGFPHSEGIIDADYINEIKIGLANEGSSTQVIIRGERIAQAELVYTPQVALVNILTEPPVKTTRAGGFGSTGR